MRCCSFLSQYEAGCVHVHVPLSAGLIALVRSRNIGEGMAELGENLKLVPSIREEYARKMTYWLRREILPALFFASLESALRFGPPYAVTHFNLAMVPTRVGHNRSGQFLPATFVRAKLRVARYVGQRHQVAVLACCQEGLNHLPRLDVDSAIPLG